LNKKLVVGREREAILIYTNTPKTMDEPIVNYSDAEEEEDVPTEASVNPEKENSLRARSFDPECKGAETKDPRGEGNRITKKARKMGTARNTESFDPQSTLVRPDFRVQFGSNKKEVFDKKLKHDDVIMVPEFFCAEDDWGLYYKLVEEIGEVQKNEKKAEWISWHEGAHLISKAPEGSSTFDSIVKKMLKYYNIDEKKPYGTRFNWYVDSSDWKPFHHDSAAFNPQRARSQDITIGASFGATRELAFIHATPQINNNKVRVYFPNTNGMMISFGRDANINWKHGINALSKKEKEESGNKGRISIILWGKAKDAIDENGSPPLLGSDGQGPHSRDRGRGGGDRRRDERRRDDRRRDDRRPDDRRPDDRRRDDRRRDDRNFDPDRDRHHWRDDRMRDDRMRDSRRDDRYPGSNRLSDYEFDRMNDRIGDDRRGEWRDERFGGGGGERRDDRPDSHRDERRRDDRREPKPDNRQGQKEGGRKRKRPRQEGPKKCFNCGSTEHIKAKCPQNAAAKSEGGKTDSAGDDSTNNNGGGNNKSENGDKKANQNTIANTTNTGDSA